MEKFTPLGTSRMAGLNSKNRITMLKNRLWEYIVVQLAAGEHQPITDRIPKNLQAAQDNKMPSTSQDGETMTRLVLELNTCRRNFVSMHKKAHINRLIFLSGQIVDKSICETIAKQLEMPAQIADCLAAVEITNPDHVGIDRRSCQENWATAFGLSLS